MRIDLTGFFPKRASWLLLASLSLAGCAAPVYMEQDPGAAFGGYHRFAWLPPVPGKVRDPILDSEIFEARVERAVMADLKTRGFEPTAADGAPDFLVTYHIANKEKLESSGSNFSFGIIDAFPHGFGSVVVGGPDVESREQGTLMLDVIDARSKRLAWRGWMKAWVTQDNYSDQAVAEAVHRILDKFPAH
jgi:hypothetical protein